MAQAGLPHFSCSIEVFKRRHKQAGTASPLFASAAIDPRILNRIVLNGAIYNREIKVIPPFQAKVVVTYEE